MESQDGPAHPLEDDAEFEKLVRRTARLLERCLANAATAGIDVESIMQETYWRAYESWSKLAALTEIQQTAWLSTTSGRLVASEMRRPDWRRRSAAQLVEDEPQMPERANDVIEPGTIAENREYLRRVCALILQLPPREQDVVIMYSLLGHDYEDVAKHLDISKGAVTTAMCRAREQLRSLSPATDEEGRR